jgi:hypothetical protein
MSATAVSYGGCGCNFCDPPQECTRNAWAAARNVPRYPLISHVHSCGGSFPHIARAAARNVPLHVSAVSHVLKAQSSPLTAEQPHRESVTGEGSGSHCRQADKPVERESRVPLRSHTKGQMGNMPPAPSKSKTRELLKDVDKYCRQAATAITQAEVLIVTTGAGFSADSGLAIHRDVAKVPAYSERKVEYHDLCVPDWLED